MEDYKKLNDYPYIDTVHKVLMSEAPYMSGVINKQYTEFGKTWLDFFEADLSTFFRDNNEALQIATRGYIKFALDGMLLQKRFDKTRQYESKSYEQASAEVYQNEKYMHTLYLPGIYLSHFLWRHHYIQHLFFIEKFVPMVKKHGGKTFYDVGVGTGFYSREMLRCIPGLQGEGFDLSPSSLSHTKKMLETFNLAQNYRCNLQDIVLNTPTKPASFITNVEVLEHLEDPVAFLKGLNKMLAPNGLGMITAAITAPNADHIYLYNSVDEVAAQAVEARFKIVDSREDAAYQPLKPNDSVPRNAVLIVTK
ncbi:MAG: class I SAM-dependent methyltransferase [Bdellovibrionota bacterium]